MFFDVEEKKMTRVIIERDKSLRNIKKKIQCANLRENRTIISIFFTLNVEWTFRERDENSEFDY